VVVLGVWHRLVLIRAHLGVLLAGHALLLLIDSLRDVVTWGEGDLPLSRWGVVRLGGVGRVLRVCTGIRVNTLVDPLGGGSLRQSSVLFGRRRCGRRLGGCGM
jgi:hypothetical protein